jgi:hypothetical protein
LCSKKIYIEENRTIWQYLELLEICPAEHFSKIYLKGLDDDVKEKRYQHESCG